MWYKCWYMWYKRHTMFRHQHRCHRFWLWKVISIAQHCISYVVTPLILWKFSTKHPISKITAQNAWMIMVLTFTHRETAQKHWKFLNNIGNGSTISSYRRLSVTGTDSPYYHRAQWYLKFRSWTLTKSMSSLSKLLYTDYKRINETTFFRILCIFNSQMPETSFDP